MRYLRGADTSPTAPRWAWLALLVIGAAGMVAMHFLFHRWQDDVRDLMGVPHLRWYNYPQAALIGLVVLFVFVEIGQWVGAGTIAFTVVAADGTRVSHSTFIENGEPVAFLDLAFPENPVRP